MRVAGIGALRSGGGARGRYVRLYASAPLARVDEVLPRLVVRAWSAALALSHVVTRVPVNDHALLMSFCSGP